MTAFEFEGDAAISSAREGDTGVSFMNEGDTVTVPEPEGSAAAGSSRWRCERAPLGACRQTVGGHRGLSRNR